MKTFLLNPRLPLCGLIVATLLFPIAAWRDFASLMNRELSGQALMMDNTLNETTPDFTATPSPRHWPRILGSLTHRSGGLSASAG